MRMLPQRLFEAHALAVQQFLKFMIAGNEPALMIKNTDIVVTLFKHRLQQTLMIADLAFTVAQPYEVVK